MPPPPKDSPVSGRGARLTPEGPAHGARRVGRGQQRVRVLRRDVAHLRARPPAHQRRPISAGQSAPADQRRPISAGQSAPRSAALGSAPSAQSALRPAPNQRAVRRRCQRGLQEPAGTTGTTGTRGKRRNLREEPPQVPAWVPLAAVEPSGTEWDRAEPSGAEGSSRPGVGAAVGKLDEVCAGHHVPPRIGIEDPGQVQRQRPPRVPCGGFWVKAQGTRRCPASHRTAGGNWPTPHASQMGSWPDSELAR